MNENILTIAFIIFVIFLVFFVAILRKISLQDVFDDNMPSSSMVALEKLSQLQDQPVPTFSQEKKEAVDGNLKVSRIAKIISVFGFIMLFVHLPEIYNFIGLALAFIGSMVAKATAPSKAQTSARQIAARRPTTKNPRDPKKSA